MTERGSGGSGIGSRKGVTLVEVMLAGAILLLASLALFEGVAAAARIAHENSELLMADAFAWDACWKRFNEPFPSLVGGMAEYVETEGEDFRRTDVPGLHYDGAPVKLYTLITNAPAGVVIDVNLEWGPANARRILMPRAGVAATACGHPVRVFRSNVSRAEADK